MVKEIKDDFAIWQIIDQTTCSKTNEINVSAQHILRATALCIQDTARFEVDLRNIIGLDLNVSTDTFDGLVRRIEDICRLYHVGGIGADRPPIPIKADEYFSLSRANSNVIDLTRFKSALSKSMTLINLEGQESRPASRTFSIVAQDIIEVLKILRIAIGAYNVNE